MQPITCPKCGLVYTLETPNERYPNSKQWANLDYYAGELNCPYQFNSSTAGPMVLATVYVCNNGYLADDGSGEPIDPDMPTEPCDTPVAVRVKQGNTYFDFVLAPT